MKYKVLSEETLGFHYITEIKYKHLEINNLFRDKLDDNEVIREKKKVKEKKLFLDIILDLHKQLLDEN